MESRSSTRTYNTNIIIVVFDALSSYHLPTYGYQEIKTPNIDSFANASIIFSPMVASSNLTAESIPSIITGKTPYKHRVYNFEWYLPSKIRNENIFKILKENGYNTYAVVQNPLTPLSSFGLNEWIDEEPFPIFNAKIFDVILSCILKLSSKIDIYGYPLLRKWMAVVFLARKGGRFEFVTLRRIKKTPYPPKIPFNKALQLIKQRERPFFLFIHIFPPHEPFFPPGASVPEIFNTSLKQANFMYHSHSEDKIDHIKILEELYEKNIEYIDKEFGEFIKKLKEAGIYDSSFIILTSDHGETFVPEWVGHSDRHLFEPMIRVPFILKTPFNNNSQWITISPSMIDIAPTILNILNLDIPEWMEGESLLPYIRGETDQKDTPCFCMHSALNKRYTLNKGSICLIKEKKLIYNLKTKETILTDPVNDPYDKQDISANFPEIKKSLQEYLFNYLGISDSL